MKYEFQPTYNPEITSYREKVSNAVSSFMQENQLKFIIGISGGSESISDRQAIWLISDFIANIQNSSCAILTGGTKGGIPEMGIKIAKASLLPTIGVFPEQGRKYALYKDLDLAIETLPPTIGNGTFGTETPSYVNLLNGAAIIGGSFGTLTEVSTILKTNNGRIRKQQEPIYLCPIKGTGGVADAILSLPGINDLLPCLPDKEITDGKNAAMFLKSKLHAL